MIAEELKNLIAEALKNLSLETKETCPEPVEWVHLEHPEDMTNGDFSSNIAMVFAKKAGVNPRELADKIKNQIEKKMPSFISKIEVAGPGFINFYLASDFFVDSINEIKKSGAKYGRNDSLKGKRAVVEYTDPNPFKEFHIGHVMSNTIGEAISRLVDFSGAKLTRACYQGDVGVHVAKAIWGIINDGGTIKDVSALGRAYAKGAKAYEDAATKQEIDMLNKKIYDRSDKEINKIYDAGRKLSLEHFEEIYQKLGTKFNHYFFESETGKSGKDIVLKFLGKNIFEKNEGAIIFRGEHYDPKLHTRVFLNSEGLPTYEAKELGLAKIKYDKTKYDLSVVITGNEVNEYFKVLMKAMELIFPDLAKKTVHISHGMMRLPSGKMSSRTGEVITGESFIDQVEEMVREKIKDRDLSANEQKLISSQVAVAAIKYSILKQAPGRDTIFDLEKSVSFEGDSGPYLQYAYTRAGSILAKAKAENVKAKLKNNSNQLFTLERLLYRFPEVIEKAQKEYAPHHVLTYLTHLAQTFNTFYGETKIIDPADPDSPYKVAITEAFSIVLSNGLYILGIQAPGKM